MSYAEEFDLPLRVSIPNLPDSTMAKDHIDAFFMRIWPLMPVVDHEWVLLEFDRLRQKQLSHPGGLGLVMSRKVCCENCQSLFGRFVHIA